MEAKKEISFGIATAIIFGMMLAMAAAAFLPFWWTVHHVTDHQRAAQKECVAIVTNGLPASYEVTHIGLARRTDREYTVLINFHSDPTTTMAQWEAGKLRWGARCEYQSDQLNRIVFNEFRQKKVFLWTVTSDWIDISYLVKAKDAIPRVPL